MLFSENEPCLSKQQPNRKCHLVVILNKRVKVLKENGYHESIISKIFKGIANNHSLSQSQQQTQATDIQEEGIIMSINLPYVEGTSEKLRRIHRSHKIRSTCNTESTLCKLLCKSKDFFVILFRVGFFYP